MLAVMAAVMLGGSLAGAAAVATMRRTDRAKACLDIVLGYVGLILAAPILAVCGIVVKLASRGPAFIIQPRVGKDGQVFGMYKLRTMYVGAESASGPRWASHRDPRVIPVCRWLRASHIDELPQLINVLKGEMSLVGPRPERQEILDGLEQRYPNVRRRLEVLPGITGLAQIRHGYDTTPERFAHKLAADMEYIRMYSLALDLKIILATIPKVMDAQAK